MSARLKKISSRRFNLHTWGLLVFQKFIRNQWVVHAQRMEGQNLQPIDVPGSTESDGEHDKAQWASLVLVGDGPMEQLADCRHILQILEEFSVADASNQKVYIY